MDRLTSRHDFNNVLNIFPDIICVKDGKGRWIMANDFCLHFYQLDDVAYYGKTNHELAEHSAFFKSLLPEIEKIDEETWLGGVLTRTEREYYRPDGRFFTFDFFKVPTFNPDGSRMNLIIIGRDITMRKKAEESLRRERDFNSAILDIVGSLVIVLDHNGQVVLFNKTSEKITGFMFNEIKGKHLWDFLFDEKNARPLKDIYNSLPSNQEVNVCQTSIITRKGGHRLISWSNAVLFNQDGAISHVICTGMDITNQKKAEEELRALSLVDYLTGLYNRRGFITLAQQQLKIARRMKREMLLIYGDLDNMKLINDTFGHHEGDRALRDIANVLKESFREPDIIARIGGDEFAVLILDTCTIKPKTLTQRLQNKLKLFNEKNNRPYKLSISTGVARYDPDSLCFINDLMEKADKRMYRNKQRKKHR